jgi:hypothetical protein
MNKDQKLIREDLVDKYVEIELMVNSNQQMILDRLNCPRNAHFLANRAECVSIF